MNQLSQRNVLWANIKLGTSNTTIGSHGCTITCISMLADLIPTDTNNRLKANGGYVNGNLVLWSAIEKAIPWLKFEWRGGYYENDRVKAAIEKNGGCLVEVDGAPIGGSKHWVLYIGNGKLIDPWDGKIKPTTSYKATGYSIINKIGNSDGGSMGNELETCLKDRQKFWDERDSLLRELNAENVEGGISSIRGLRSRSTDLGNQVGTLQAEVNNRKEQVSRIESQLLDTQAQLKLIDEQLQKALVDLKERSIEKGALAIEVEQLKVKIESLKQAQTEGGITLTIGEVIRLILKQKITIKK